MSEKIWRIRVDFINGEISGSATVKVKASEANFCGPTAVEMAEEKLKKKFDVDVIGSKFLSEKTK